MDKRLTQFHIVLFAVVFMQVFLLVAKFAIEPELDWLYVFAPTIGAGIVSVFIAIMVIIVVLSTENPNHKD